MPGFKLYYLILFLFLVGCMNPFAPALTEKDLNTSLLITDQLTPQEVLTNFRYAYLFKDSLIYSETLDSSFLFISKNYSTDPPSDIIWGRDVDMQTTARLFRNCENIKLDWNDYLYTRIDTIQIDSLTRAALYAEIRVVFLITFTFDDGRQIPTLKGEALFNFIRKPSGIWRITRWEDLYAY